MTDEELAEIFSQELDREGANILAAHIRAGIDNSQGGRAAMRALRRVADLTQGASSGEKQHDDVVSG